jgi:gliding motility-associated-like protein
MQSFSTVFEIPECTTIDSPADATVNIAVSTSINWSAVANSDGYLLTVGTSSGGTDIVDNLDVANTLTYDFPNDLPEGTEIFVTLTPYNQTGSATGCTEVSFTTEMIQSIPECTRLSTELTNAITVAVSSDLTWDAISNATGYFLLVGTTPGGNDILDNFDVGNETTYDLPANLPFEQEIFVTITPYNALGNATSCSEESFSTPGESTPPACTNLLTPVNMDIDVPVNTVLSWNAIADATGYQLTVGTGAGLTDILDSQDIGNLTTFNLPNDLPETTEIFVSVVPYNANGTATGCVEESFITETLVSQPELPSCTSINLPMDGDTNIPVNTSLRWNAVGNVDGYILHIGTSDGGTDIIDGLNVGLTTSYELTDDLPSETEIFVSIIPYNGTLQAENCTSQSFFTISEEPEEEEDLTQYGFSPNGDGINDFWTIDGIEASPENTVTIYNRWGDMVFQVQGYDNRANAFDGTANEKTKMGANELPSGTYFFNIEVTGEHNLKKLQGYLVIKR